MNYISVRIQSSLKNQGGIEKRAAVGKVIGVIELYLPISDKSTMSSSSALQGSM